MRALVALTVYVSLGTGPAFSADAQWKLIHDQGVAALQRADFQGAAQLFQQCWGLAATPVEYGLSANDLGVALHRLNRDNEAAQWLERALTIWKRNDDRDQRRIATTSEALAAVLRAQGRYPSAERLLRETVLNLPLQGEEKALILNMLGDLMREQGKSAESRKLFEEALGVPGVPWKMLAEAHSGLADLDRDNSFWEESAAEWNTVAALAREHNDTALEAVACRGIGATWLDQGNTARAEPLLRRALSIFESDPHSADQAASTLSFMAQLYLDEDKPALAEEALTRVLANDERSFGETHPQVALLLEMLGDAAALANRIDSARAYYGRALRIMAERFGENSMMAGAVFANWAVAEQRAGDPSQAAAEFEKALAILRAGGRDAAALRATVLARYANLLKSMHREKEAHALLAEARGFRPN
jgi:tetratricopeptide (TPR) repeat protein